MGLQAQQATDYLQIVFDPVVQLLQHLLLSIFVQFVHGLQYQPKQMILP